MKLSSNPTQMFRLLKKTNQTPKKTQHKISSHEGWKLNEEKTIRNHRTIGRLDCSPRNIRPTKSHAACAKHKNLSFGSSSSPFPRAGQTPHTAVVPGWNFSPHVVLPDPGARRAGTKLKE